MLTRAEAHDLIDRHFGDGSRAEHSRLVGRLMRRIALLLSGDPDLWELTGLCHDLDYEVTRATPKRHGLVAALWLEEGLPAEALDAIRAHDHRTGVTSGAPIAHALKLVDALAVLLDHGGTPSVIDALRRDDPAAALLACEPSRPWLAPMILGNATSLGLSPTDLAVALAEE